MVLATPEEQARAGYLFFAPERYEYLWVTALVPQGEPLFLDGAPARGASVGTLGGLEARHLRVTSGAHSLTGRTGAIRFSATVTGLANYASFAYPAGFTLAPIAPR